jgi:type VI protein secretion system component Hcp
VTFASGPALVDHLEALATGRHLDAVSIEVCLPAVQQPQGCFQRFDFPGAVVTHVSYDHDGATGNVAVHVIAPEMTWTLRDGSGGTQSATFDIANNVFPNPSGSLGAMSSQLPAVQSPTPFLLGSQSFDVAAISSNASNTTTIGGTTGGTGTGQSEFDALVVEKMVDQQTLQLAHLVASGEHVPTARYVATGLTVDLGGVTVNAITIDSSLEEHVALRYAEIEWDASGNRFRWNIAENRAS